MKKILLILLLCLTIITTVNAAANWTTSFDTTNTNAIYNQSRVIDNSGSTPWEMWAASGLIGLVLFLLSLRPRTSPMELEVDAIIAGISVIPIIFCGWASFNVDRIVGYGVTNQLGEYVYMENHIIYNLPVIGIIMFILAGVAVFNIFRILAQHKLFQIKNQEEELAKNKPKFGAPPQSNEPDKPQ